MFQANLILMDWLEHGHGGHVDIFSIYQKGCMVNWSASKIDKMIIIISISVYDLFPPDLIYIQSFSSTWSRGAYCALKGQQ